MNWAKVGVALLAVVVAALVAACDQGIIDFRFQTYWVGVRQATLSLGIYLGIHGLAAVALTLSSFAVLHPPSEVFGADALYGLSLGLTTEAFLRAQWPRSINHAGRLFSLIDMLMDRVMKIRGHRTAKAIRGSVEDLDDSSLGQLAMDLLHEHTLPKATESAQREILREARANIDAVHGSRLGREADARAALRRTCRLIIASERETLKEEELGLE